MRFVTAVIHHVVNLEAASDFFCTVLGFAPKNATKTSVFLDNGSVSVRLMLSETNVIQNTLRLELYCRNLESATQELLAFSDISMLAEKQFISLYRIETDLQAPHNLHITLVQEFNEDEVGVLPPLPSCLDWQPDAQRCIQELLTLSPLAFRESARKRVTEQAEFLAAEQGLISVELNLAIQALIQITPTFQHPTLAAALQKRGLNSEIYFQSLVL